MTSPTPPAAFISEQSEEPSEFALPGKRVTVTLADVAPFTVRVTNRDFVAWDKTAPRHKWGKASDVPFLFATFISWSAARRDGQTALQFEAFLDACEDVTELEEESTDPTRTGHGLS